MKKFISLTLCFAILLSFSRSLSAYASHSHSDVCYNGSKHTHTSSSCGYKGETICLDNARRTAPNQDTCVTCNGSGYSGCWGTMSRDVNAEGVYFKNYSSYGSVYRVCNVCSNSVLIMEQAPMGRVDIIHTVDDGPCVCKTCAGTGKMYREYFDDINGVKRYAYFAVVSACGKDTTSYYNGSSIVTATCNQVVKSLTLKK